MKNQELNDLLNGVFELSNEKLAKAYDILYGFENYNTKCKADEMRSILKGELKPCIDFVNWVKCIDYLKIETNRS